MHVQVVTFGLNVTEEEYHQACTGETELFGSLPGLLAKIWLRNGDTKTYGAVYFWRDRASYEAYVKGEIFESIANDPTLSDVTSRSFDVFGDLTGATMPGLTIG